MKRFRNNKKGFTLVEIMSVVAIIGMITAMSIPHFLRIKVGANEAAAQANLKSLYAVMEDYHFTFGDYPDVPKGPEMGIIVAFVKQYYGSHPVICSGGGEDSTYGSYCMTQGYRYDLSSITTGFIWIAMPDLPGVTGNRYFVISETGEVRESSYDYAKASFPITVPGPAAAAGAKGEELPPPPPPEDKKYVNEEMGGAYSDAGMK